MQLTRDTPTGTPPSPRSGFSLTALGRDRLALFGGYSRAHGRPLNDTHLLARQAGGGWHWMEVDTPEPPEPRHDHSADLIGGKLVVFGGFRNAEWLGRRRGWGRALSDVVVLDLASQTWAHPRVHGSTPTAPRSSHATATTPAPRSSHATAVIGNKLVVFGGTTYRNGPFSGPFRRRYTDLFVLDTSGLEDPRDPWVQWASPEVGGDVPRGRCDHRIIPALLPGWGPVLVSLGGCMYIMKK
eukprot:CAMPEP_0182897004 /NCGR_PEP_ID=MMETSP0034_2-20130328/26625_1 /TAXON_ID=156128 /ORGANISM="Nephroselmis pyriformis, Strain CCMP717" /LENGTH=240 /DNA_ID=CAMNT_0025030897 /DNA_START=29 /DNA_END=748 /DNA_ORIENTATION=+